MKYLLIPILSGICMFPVTDRFIDTQSPVTVTSELPCPETIIEPISINFLQQPGKDGKMYATVFKNQKYCRAEVEDFVFDVPFRILSATVYFSGANFPNVVKGEITSNDLKPIADLMARCGPGSVVTFDDIKVIGPDKIVRTILGRTWVLK